MSTLGSPGDTPLQPPTRESTVHPFESNPDSAITEAPFDIEGFAGNSRRDIIPVWGRSHDSRIRQLVDDLAVLGRRMKQLQVDMIIAYQKIDGLQKSNRLLQQETSSLRYDLYLARANRPAEGIQFMKFPTEIRLMIWHLAAGSDRQSNLEIIQPRSEEEISTLSPPFDQGLSIPPLGFSFLVRCYSPRRIIAQACREAQHILQPIGWQPRRFPTPMWSCMNGERDSLILPHTLQMPLDMHYRDLVGLAKHVIVVPDPVRPHYAFLEWVSETTNQLLKAVLNHEIELQRMSFVMTEIRVSPSVQAHLEFEFKSYLPLAIDLDDQRAIDRVDEIFEEFAPNTFVINDIRSFDGICLRARTKSSPTNIRQPWEQFQKCRRERALRACGWDESIIAGLVGNRGRRTKIPSAFREAYNQMPEFRRVIMIYGSFEGPESAPIVGLEPVESPRASEGRGRGMFGHVPRVAILHDGASCPHRHTQGR